ncbi:hypothetical protein [Spiroplasma endosymbiont of Clivina fossor]
MQEQKNKRKILILSKTLDKIKKIINLIILKGFYVKLLFLL